MNQYLISRKSVQWGPTCPTWTHGRTDRHDNANSRFWQHFGLAKHEIRMIFTSVTTNPTPNISTLADFFGERLLSVCRAEGKLLAVINLKTTCGGKSCDKMADNRGR